MNPAVATLIRFARAIGRWLLKHLLRRGATMLRGYMLGKIDDFWRRLSRARTPRRKRWLKSRIARWQVVTDWLGEKHVDMAGRFAEEADSLVGDIPMVAAAEREPR